MCFIETLVIALTITEILKKKKSYQAIFDKLTIYI